MVPFDVVGKKHLRESRSSLAAADRARILRWMGLVRYVSSDLADRNGPAELKVIVLVMGWSPFALDSEVAGCGPDVLALNP